MSVHELIESAESDGINGGLMKGVGETGCSADAFLYDIAR